MNAESVGLFLDILVLIFLGIMIFYAMRLSSSLKNFRAQRGEFDKVIADLLSSIDQAERSINELRHAGEKESAELSDLIRKAKLLSEELKDVNQVSEGMASRLELLAEKNRKIVQGIQDDALRVSSSGSHHRPETVKPSKNVMPPQAELPSFMIQDKDFEDLDALGERLGGAASNDTRNEDDEQDMPEDLQSQAERELYEALRHSRKTGKRRE